MNFEKSLTVNDFRRRFFSGKNRPAKKTIVDWIETGTIEGRRLKATKLDGRFYIREVDAVDFLNAPASVPKLTLAARRKMERQARYVEALDVLKNQFGFNYL